MAYKKQTFVDKVTRLKAEHLEHIESGIVDLEEDVDVLETNFSELEIDMSELEENFSEIEKKISDLMYNAIDISSFTNKIDTAYNNINYVEIGSEVGTVDLSWKVNKTPKMLTLDGVEIKPTLTSYTSPGPITADKTYTLKATDERGSTDLMTTKIVFCNGVYYGSISADATIDNDTILALGKNIRSSRAGSFKTTQASQRGIFVCPVSYGTPQFKIGETPLPYTWEKVNTEPFMLTNQHGYINPDGYNIWRSFQNCGAKDTVITVV